MIADNQGQAVFMSAGLSRCQPQNLADPPSRLLKCQASGHASFELLRKRVSRAAGIASPVAGLLSSGGLREVGHVH
jgi:hypothetical protein